MKQRNGRSARRVGQVRITFTNKPITAWGGLGAVVAKFLERIAFRAWVQEHVPIEESSNNARGVYEKVLGQFLTVLAGGERFAHLSWWGHGVEALRKAFAVKWLPGAPSTLTRFWGKIDRQGLSERLGDGARSLARQIVRWEGIDEDNVNLDSTVMVRYGRQEGAKKGYNARKPGRPSHHPLLAFLGSGYVVNAWNRSGDAFSGQSAKDFFLQTIASLGDRFRVRYVLADTGFYQAPFIVYLESQSYRYIIAVRLHAIVQQCIQRVTQWRRIAPGIEVGQFWFEHLSEKWTQPRRYVVVRQEVARRPQAAGKQPSLFRDLPQWREYRFSVFITNDHDAAPEAIWREYRPRACDENVIKDLKEGYGFASFNLSNFWATEAVLIMNTLVFHNLVHCLARTILTGRKGVVHQLRTLRSKYFILPAQLGSSAGRAILRLGVRDRSLRGKINYFLERIDGLPWRLNCNAVEGGGGIS